MARPPGLEPGTSCLEGTCTIRLCYGRGARKYRTKDTSYSTISRPWQSFPGSGFSVQICSSCMTAVTSAITIMGTCADNDKSVCSATERNNVVIDRQKPVTNSRATVGALESAAPSCMARLRRNPSQAPKVQAKSHSGTATSCMQHRFLD